MLSTSSIKKLARATAGGLLHGRRPKPKFKTDFKLQKAAHVRLKYGPGLQTLSHVQLL